MSRMRPYRRREASAGVLTRCKTPEDAMDEARCPSPVESRARSTARSGRYLDAGILGWQTTPWRAVSRWEQRDHRTHRHALWHLATAAGS
jgi:hypothetical protein